jgi:hypothetical protein
VTGFFRTLHRVFKSARADYHLSWAAPPVINKVEKYAVAWADYAAAARELDALTIMAYAMNPPTVGWTTGSEPVAGGGEVSGHARDLETLVADYAEATQGRKDKLLLGIATSRGGIEWDCRGVGPLSPIIGEPRPLSPEEARANAVKYGRMFDPVQQYSWYRYRRKNGEGWVQGWYEDDESLQAKLTFARGRGFGGVCIWALDGAREPAETFSLLRKYRGDSGDAAGPKGARGPKGRTDRSPLWGDCHVHSRYSDGMLRIPDMAGYYEAFGVDFRIQTDHLIVAVPEGKPAGDWMHSGDWARYAKDCADGSTARHLCIPGAEIGWAGDEKWLAAGGWYHTKLYPQAGKPAPAESFFKGMTYSGALKALRRQGFKVVVAHADQRAPLDRLTGDEVDGLELRWDIEETRPLIGRSSIAHWDRMLAAGHRVSLSSGSDAHQPDEWAGSGLRTVVLDTPREPDAIVDAVVTGRSYLSGTWHPDCYADLGFPEHANAVAGGTTHFTPWWDFGSVPSLAKANPADLIANGFRAALEWGRCRREDYPVLEEFSVAGAGSGRETRAGRKEVVASWRTQLPVRLVRLIAGGRPVYEMPTTHGAYGKTRGELRETLDLRGERYVRLEIEAFAPADSSRRECLMANPVYLTR